MFARESHFFGTSIVIKTWSPSMWKKLGLSYPYRLWGDEKECQTCSFRSSSRKINQFRVNRYIVVSLLTLQEQFSQTGQYFARWIRNKTKTLCSTEICLLTTKALYSFNLLFFRVLLLPQQNEIQLVSRFFLSSKPFGPGNWIQSLAMPVSLMNAGGGFPYKSDGGDCLLALGCKLQILVSLRVFGIESHSMRGQKWLLL